MATSGNERRPAGDPLLRSQQSILQREVHQAEGELRRPARGLFLSGIIAGSGVTISPLLRAVVVSRAPADLPELWLQLLVAVVYAVGFIIVILSHVDLFTEYTTMAILPVLSGHATTAALVRVWLLVYAGNLIGVAAFAGLVVILGPRLHIAEPAVFTELAVRLVEPTWWVMLMSAFLTGWLMGLLSWLVSAAGDAVSQILFVWLITASIGFAHLHHVITGSGEVLMGLWTGEAMHVGQVLHFLVWTTLGNAAGGVVFAYQIQYSVVITGSRKDDGPRR